MQFTATSAGILRKIRHVEMSQSYLYSEDNDDAGVGTQKLDVYALGGG